MTAIFNISIEKNIKKCYHLQDYTGLPGEAESHKRYLTDYIKTKELNAKV